MSEQSDSKPRVQGRHVARPASPAPEAEGKAPAAPVGAGKHAASGEGAAPGAAKKGAGKKAAGRKAANGGRKSKKKKKAAGKKPRRGAAERIVRRSLVAAAVLVLLLGVLALFRPQINLARAHRFIAAGKIVSAEELLEYMLRADYDEAGIADVRFDLGEYYLGQGDFARVYALLRELPEDDRSRDLELRARYAEACALLEARELDRAAQQFYLLGDYSDSARLCDDARTAIAMRTWIGGDEDGARRLFADIDDPGAHAAAAARLISADESEAAAILAREAFAPDALTDMARTYRALSEAREDAAGDRIAAGECHSVGLRDDGTVLAAGDNHFGQCDVSGWSDIVQVAAGAKHTVGLRLDGTVVAAGDDSFGQCDVSGWTGITAVAANSYSTIGLRSDGTVVATRLMQSKVSGWHGVRRVTGGSYSVGCLYGQGGMLCSHRAAQLEVAAALKRFSVCGAVSAGIGEDGRLVSSYDKAPAWTDLVDIAVTQTGFLGVTRDGRALSRFFRGGEEQALPVEGHATEIAGSGTHVLILSDNGRVFAYGVNSSGQCDVSDWKLF